MEPENILVNLSLRDNVNVYYSLRNRFIKWFRFYFNKIATYYIQKLEMNLSPFDLNDNFNDLKPHYRNGIIHFLSTDLLLQNQYCRTN